MEKLAQELEGDFTDYPNQGVTITVSVGNYRYQSIKTFIRDKDRENHRKMLTFSSIICKLSQYEIADFRPFLHLNNGLDYARVALTEDGTLEIVSSINHQLYSMEEIRYMLLEIAHTADKLEQEITKKDIY